MLPYLLAAIVGAGGPTGVITLKTDNMEFTLDSASCFSVVVMKYDGTPLTVNAGGQGAVINNGDWIGGAMKSGGEEQVEELTITADQIELLDLEKVTGGDLTFEVTNCTIKKTSKLATIAHTAETNLKDGVIVQTHSFEFTEEISLKSFYAFIYSFTPEMTNWIGEDVGGSVTSGECAGEGGHPFSRPAKWFALFNSAPGKGMVVHYQTQIEGSTTIWDAAGYRKYFVQPMKGVIAAGTKLSYTIVMKPFSADAEGWEDAAKSTATELAAAFPVTVAETPVQPNVLYDEGVPEHGFMTAQTDNYKVLFEASSAWTMDEISYKDTVVAGPTGHFGTVLVPAGGKWIGTGHTEGGREVVHTLALTVDGVDTPIEVGATFTGHEIVLTKTSTIHKFAATHTITITDDEIVERAQLHATEAHDLKLMYLFMHCWEPSTTTYLAELADGELVEGTLVADKGMEVNADARWVAQYMPENSFGLLQYMPEVATGPGSATKIWDQPRYHKCYIQTNLARSLAEGEELDYTVVLRVVEGEDGSWTATKAAVEELMTRYPHIDPADEGEMQ